MTKFGLLAYDEDKTAFNLGDNIQSLAARQFLPRVDSLINREEMAAYNGGPTKMIFNGWFTHNTRNWVPSSDIDPLFVSFHINNTAAPAMLDARGVSYLKSHAPIGCRDEFSAQTLRAHGIDAYFTGCLTLTLDNYKVDDTERNDQIFIVDPLYSYPTVASVTKDPRTMFRSLLNGDAQKVRRRDHHLKRLIDQDLFDTAQHRTQVPPSNTFSEQEKLDKAEALLKEYARARLVITSRIHCALPCLALGTPVIFINGFDRFVDSCRFDGILDLFNRIDVDTETGEFSANFPLASKIGRDTMVENLGRHHSLAEPLKNACRAFVAS